MKKLIHDSRKTLTETGSALPYVLGWFMGVPTSILLLIFLLRSC